MTAPRIIIEKRVEVFPERFQQAVNSPTGTIALKTQTTAFSLLAQAQAEIGIRRYSGHHPEYGRRLKDSGTVVKGSAHGPDWVVTFKHPIAVLHHEGARAHTIGQPGKILYRASPLPATSYSSTPFFRRGVVHHPGAKANPYLTNAARKIGLQPSGALRRGSSLVPLVRGFA